MTLRGVDWFAGKGGYTLAMRRAGIEVVGACELVPKRRTEYVSACGMPASFGENCETYTPPPADLWTACASVPALMRWLGGYSRTPHKLPVWLVLETVTVNMPDLWPWLRDQVAAIHVAAAGARTFAIVGPPLPSALSLPAHDGQGPESDPVALEVVLGAIIATPATTYSSRPRWL